MAVINLKVLVDGSAIDAEISKINSSFNKGIKGTAVDNLQKKYANLISTVKNYEKSFPKGTFEKQTASLTRHLDRVKELSQSYERSGKLTKDQQKQYRQLSKDYADISAKVATLRAETEKLEKSNKQSIPSVDNLRKKYANLLNTIQGSEKNYKKGTFSKIAEEAKANLDILKNLDPASADYAKTVNHLDKELNRLSADFSETRSSATNFHGSLQDIVSGFLKFQLAATLVMKPLQLLRQEFEHMIKVLVETESRIVALQRVAGKVANAEEIYELGERYAESFENVADVVERFAKAGYSWEDSLKAAESALTAMKVAEMDSEQATEGLIAVMKQFGLEISDLDNLVDMLNKTADNYAVNTDELLVALQKTGSVAKNAGLDVKDTIGLITALSEGTAASGANIGNALRSLFIFTSDDKALETFAGLSSGMSGVVKSYRAGKSDILDVWQALAKELGNKKDLKEVFNGVDLSEDMEAELTQIQDQLAEIYGTAGNYRQNYFIALMDNIDTAKKAIEETGNAAGYSQDELNNELQTYENMVQSINTRWEGLLNNNDKVLAVMKDIVLVANELLDILEMASSLTEVDNKLFGFEVEPGVLPTLWANASDELKSSWIEISLASLINPILGMFSLGSHGGGWVAGLFKKDGKKISSDNITVTKKVADYFEDIKENVQTINKDLSELNDTALKGIVDKLREARDATKDAYDYEEKKKAVLDAEQALLDAQNNRTTRVLNSKTGQWEWMANEREIQKAQEELDRARLDVEQAAFDNIIDDLESGNATNSSILAILASWESAYGSGDFSGVSEEIKGILKQNGVDVNAPTQKDFEKANAIFKPVSAQDFISNIKQYGLLSGPAKSIMESAGITSIFNNDTRSVDSHDTYINGVPISEIQAQKYTINELFQTIPLIMMN